MLFRTPLSILIRGPSECCKTTFVTKLLEQLQKYFDDAPCNIHYAYGAWQKDFHAMGKKA